LGALLFALLAVQALIAPFILLDPNGIQEPDPVEIVILGRVIV
jgi:hypothetical protein